MSDPISTPPGSDGKPQAVPGDPPDIAARAAAAAKADAAPRPAAGEGKPPSDPVRDTRPAAASTKPAAAASAAAKPALSPRPATSAPPPATPRPPAPPSRRAGAVLTALAVALLAGGLGVVWNQQRQAAERAVAPEDVAALREQVRTLQQRIGQIEQRPAPPPAPAPTVDLRPLEERIAALEQRPAPAAPAAGPDPAVADRLAALDRRLAEAEAAAAKAESAAAQAQQNAARAGQDAAARTARLARVQAAAAALEAGRPLGELPSAPSALARFATSPPPTESALRLSFPEAAQRARAASRMAESDQGIGDRVMAQLRNLVTVREGDTVLLGTPAAEVLGRAQARLNVGDLAGAVAALDALDPAAAAAIADWRDRAAALLAARAAISTMLAE